MKWQANYLGDHARARVQQTILRVMTTHPLFNLLDRLDTAKIHYTLSRNRPDSVLVSMTIVAMRVEVDVFRDGHIEVCTFTGSEAPSDIPDQLDRIIREHTD